MIIVFEGLDYDFPDRQDTVADGPAPLQFSVGRKELTSSPQYFGEFRYPGETIGTRTAEAQTI